MTMLVGVLRDTLRCRGDLQRRCDYSRGHGLFFESRYVHQRMLLYQESAEDFNCSMRSLPLTADG